MTAFPGVDWTEFKNTIDSAMASYAQEPITWKRHKRHMSRVGEDDGFTYDTITLYGLITYDDWRIWPLNRMTTSGQVDFEHVALLLNKQALATAGYINAQGNFDFDPGYDRFIIDGLVYKPGGDTALAQAGPNVLIFQILLQREENVTADSLR